MVEPNETTLFNRRRFSKLAAQAYDLLDEISHDAPHKPDENPLLELFRTLYLLSNELTKSMALIVERME